jgi:hypothetical protein
MPACATALTLSRFALLACAMAAVGSPQRDRAKRAKVLTDEDLARLDEVWASDEEREEVRRAPESQAVDVEALQGAGLSQVQNLLRSQPSSGPAMMFAEVDYPGCCQDEGKTKELSQRWDAMLHTAGMAVQTYVIDPGTILFSTQHGSHAGEMRDFVLQQVRACHCVRERARRGLTAASLLPIVAARVRLFGLERPAHLGASRNGRAQG